MVSYFVWSLKNTLLLALQWCLGVAALFIQVSTTSIAASAAAGPHLATLPVGLLLGIAAVSAALVPNLIQNYGSRIVFCTAGLCGVVGALISVAAIAGGATFALLVVGAIPQGYTYACTNNLRFAVMQFTTPEFASRAIAFVIAGGIFSAGIGPEASKYTRTSLPKEFLGSYILLLGIYVAMCLVPLCIDFHLKHPPGDDDGKGDDRSSDLKQAQDSGNSDHKGDTDNSDAQAKTGYELVETGDIRPAAATDATSQQEGPNNTSQAPAPDAPSARDLQEIVFNWPFLFVLLCEFTAYSAMGGLMTATPLAMQAVGYNFNQSTSAVQLHMLGMFLPSIFTGEIVKLFGKVLTMLIGFCILLLGAGLYLIGTNFAAFLGAITIVGVGWNLSFVPATALFTTLYRPEEKAKTQAFNDVVVIGVLAILMATAGAFVTGVGWRNFVIAYMCYTAVALILTAIYYTSQLLVGNNPDNINLLIAQKKNHQQQQEGAFEGVPTNVTAEGGDNDIGDAGAAANN